MMMAVKQEELSENNKSWKCKNLFNKSFPQVRDYLSGTDQ